LERKYTIRDHNDGKTYDITEDAPILDPNGYPIYTKNTAIPITEAAKLHQQTKQEYDTDKLIAEARSLIEYNKRFKENVTPVKTKRELELERSAKEWEQYYADNQGKIPREFPKSIFDKE
jgi:hypothetical protein